ncbi:MAG: multicopper oxidase family protein [Hyphomicrobiales bacterium]
MSFTRRDLLLGAAALGISPALPHLVLASTGDGNFDLTAAPQDLSLVGEGGPLSPLWTYNGGLPGPELRVRKGQRVRVNFTNQLEEPTSVHWHGIRIENAMDGVAGLTQAPVIPGESFSYDFVAPDAGTYWYHAHNRSWNQVARGLYGSLIVDEPERPFDAEHDITLMIDDWRLVGEGTLDVASIGELMDWSHAGRLGNYISVNGKLAQTLNLRRGEPYRLRLINAANARVFEFDPNRFGAKVIGYDGQNLPEPTALTYAPLLLGPAQRVDLLVTPQDDFALEAFVNDQAYPITRFEVTGDGRDQSPVPAIASSQLPEPDLGNAKRIRIEMAGGAMGGQVDMTYQGRPVTRQIMQDYGQLWAFNGIANLTEDPFFEAALGETIVIETVNQTRWVHAMHVHGHHFRVINRSGAEVDDGQPWRDTFLIGAQQTTEIAFVADNPGKWLYHCHMLEHAAAGMNSWFEVT